MPDAKSLLPGRAFRSEHAQLRPEPHSIASHGPDPMDPLQTTRMRNGVLYAAEWPCCHDPLRLSLGSEDPYPRASRVDRKKKHAARPSPRGGRAGCAPAPRARRGAPPPRGWTSSSSGPRAPHTRKNPSIYHRVPLAVFLEEQRVCLVRHRSIRAKSAQCVPVTRGLQARLEPRPAATHSEPFAVVRSFCQSSCAFLSLFVCSRLNRHQLRRH